MFKAAIKFQLITILSQAFSFLASLQVAHYLSVHDRGILGTNLLYITLILAIGNSGYNEYVSRAAKEGIQVNFYRLISSGFIVSFVLITCAVYFGLVYLSFLNLFFIYFIIFFYYYSVLSQTYMWGKGFDNMMLIMRVLTALFLPLVLFLLFAFGFVSDQWFLFATFLVYFFLSVIHFIWQRKNNVRLFEFRGGNSMGMLFYNSISTILLMIIFNIDKLVISSTVSTDIYAKYLIAIAIFSPVSELMASISSVIIIKLDKSQDVFNKTLLLLGVYLIILIFVGNVLVYLIPIVFGSKYQDSVQIAKHFPFMFFFIVSFRIFDSLLRVYNLKLSSIINLLGLILFLFFYFLAKFLFNHFDIQNLSMILTFIFGLIVFVQLFFYYKYGRTTK
jgi:O-antigen/teichoic acid export membrane protein